MAQSTPSSVNSSLDSVRMSVESAAGATAGAKNVNFLSQLEHMMSSVKKEAAALEGMKAKLKDLDDIKRKLEDAKSKVTTAESENNQLKRMIKESDDQNLELRNDMQRLNDIYYAERNKVTESQQIITRLEQEISGIKHEKEFFSKEANKIPELKSIIKTNKSQLITLKKTYDDEKILLDEKLNEINKKYHNLEKLNEESGKHLYNLTEKLNLTTKQMNQLEDDIIINNNKYNIKNEQYMLLLNRYLMCSEDLFIKNNEKPNLINIYENKLDQLKIELQKTKTILNTKTNELFIIQTNNQKLNEKLDFNVQKYINENNILQTNITELTNKNNEIIKSNSNIKLKLSNKLIENEQLLKENNEIKNNLKSIQLSTQQKELEYTSNTKALNLHNEEITFQLESLTTKYDNLQTQIKVRIILKLKKELCI